MNLVGLFLCVSVLANMFLLIAIGALKLDVEDARSDERLAEAATQISATTGQPYQDVVDAIIKARRSM